MNRGPFNICVYGILIDQDTLLVSDERYGGLEVGEGTMTVSSGSFKRN